MKKLLKPIYEWLDNYFSRDERELLRQKDLKIRGLAKSIGVLKKELLEKDKRIALYESEIKILQRKIENSSRIMRTMERVYKILDKSYRRVIIEYKKRKVPVIGKDLPLLANDFVRPSNTLAYHLYGFELKDIWHYRIDYVSDAYRYNGAIDEWQFPEETLLLRKGDCDDSTAFRVSAVKSLGLEKGFRLFMAVGMYHGMNGSVGHAFPVMIMENGKWYVLEATNNRFSMVEYPDEHYSISFLWDENYAWQVGGNTFGGKVLKWFDLHKKRQK